MLLLLIIALLGVALEVTSERVREVLQGEIFQEHL